MATSLEEPELLLLTGNPRTPERLGRDRPRTLVQAELATVDVEDLTDQVGEPSCRQGGKSATAIRPTSRPSMTTGTW